MTMVTERWTSRSSSRLGSCNVNNALCKWPKFCRTGLPEPPIFDISCSGPIRSSTLTRRLLLLLLLLLFFFYNPTLKHVIFTAAYDHCHLVEKKSKNNKFKIAMKITCFRVGVTAVAGPKKVRRLFLEFFFFSVGFFFIDLKQNRGGVHLHIVCGPWIKVKRSNTKHRKYWM